MQNAPFNKGDKVQIDHETKWNPEWGERIGGTYDQVFTVRECYWSAGNGHWFVRVEEFQDKYPDANCYAKSLKLATPTHGRKDDSGKLDMTLYDDMPRALAAVAEVMQWAVEKKQPVPYTRSSWLGVHADRYRAAIQRHTRDSGEQASKTGHPDTAEFVAPRFQRDKETQLLHLSHIACSALMALENTLRELEQE